MDYYYRAPNPEEPKKKSRAWMAITAAFAGGILLSAGAFGVISAANGGDDSNDNSSVAATQTDNTGSGADDGQVAAVSGDCISAADIYEEVRDSVVEVDIAGTTNNGFGNQEIQGTGTGIVLDKEGYILTNNHVVASADTVSVKFSDGGTAEATVIGQDPANDLAVIQIDPADHDLSPATLGNSDDLRVGDPVLALGNPFNLEGSLTQGIVSALDRTYTATGTTRPIRGMIQTDAAINPGNSGGPLLNCYGDVIGINTLLENPSGDSVNVGVAFSVAINTAKNELASLKGGETISHAWLGIAGADVTPALNDELNLGTDSGVYITTVQANSPADDAGLVAAFDSAQQIAGDLVPGGDVIISADGEDMTGIDQLATYLADQKKPGDTVDLRIVRDGDELTVTVTLADWPLSEN